MPDKLSKAHKQELASFFRGDIRYETNKQDQEVLKELYAEMLSQLVDSYGNTHPLGVLYKRDIKDMHCGKQLKILDGRAYCEVCGRFPKVK